MKLGFRMTLFLLLHVAAPWSPLVAGPEGSPAPVELRITNDPVCLPAGGEVWVHFDVETSLSDITDWYWDFGDGRDSDQASPMHDYRHTGSFAVSLTAQSLSSGPVTVVEENFVQINELIFEDYFNDISFTAANWQHFDPILIQDAALEFDLSARNDPQGQQSGSIICLGPGGAVFQQAEASGRFGFDLELSAGDVTDVTYKALRLLAGSEALAELRVRSILQGFELQIASAGVNESPWLLLAGSATPKARVELDWHQVPGSTEGALELGVIDLADPDGPRLSLRLDKLYYQPGQPGFDTLELGVIEIDSGPGQSAGTMRVDNFRACRFEHRPDPH